jgi:protein-disulfide isomerase
MKMNRRLAAFGAMFAALALVTACSQGADAKPSGAALSKWEKPGEPYLGSPKAKVVIIEYASVTCIHCYHFDRDVLPTIKKNYVDTGKVRYVFRDFPTPPVEIAMAGHLIAQCAGPAKRHSVIETLFRQQDSIMRAAQGPTGARQALLNVAASAGMDEAKFNACLADQAQIKKISDGVDEGVKTYGITGTPSIIINGEIQKDPKVLTPAGLSEILDAKLKG